MLYLKNFRSSLKAYPLLLACFTNIGNFFFNLYNLCKLTSESPSEQSFSWRKNLASTLSSSSCPASGRSGSASILLKLRGLLNNPWIILAPNPEIASRPSTCSRSLVCTKPRTRRTRPTDLNPCILKYKQMSNMLLFIYTHKTDALIRISNKYI